MRNRAKCKLCSSIIESFHSTDWIVCKCEEIAVGGGESFQCAARDWNNFLRIDDDGNEIEVKVVESLPDKMSTLNHENNKNKNIKQKPSKSELLEILNKMIQDIEKLPLHEMNNPVNYYDFSSLLILLFAIMSDDCNSES
jgi:hypothetical protein